MVDFSSLLDHAQLDFLHVNPGSINIVDQCGALPPLTIK